MESNTILIIIAFVTTTLGFIVAVMKLVLHSKQLKRENLLFQKMEKENKEEISSLNLKLDMEMKQKETLELAMDMISTYFEEELPTRLRKYAKSIELDSLKNELVLYLKDEISQIKDSDNSLENQKKNKATKTLAEAFGINIYNLKPAGRI